MKIVSRWDANKVLWEGECDNIREELIAAVASKADLGYANLRYANLGSVRNPPMQSHAFWAELLRRAAGDNLHRRMVAGLVAVSTDWCWPRMIALMTGELAQDWQEWAGAVFWAWPEQCREIGLPEIATK
jgi:hypothetical protein